MLIGGGERKLAQLTPSCLFFVREGICRLGWWEARGRWVGAIEHSQLRSSAPAVIGLVRSSIPGYDEVHYVGVRSSKQRLAGISSALQLLLESTIE